MTVAAKVTSIPKVCKRESYTFKMMTRSRDNLTTGKPEPGGIKFVQNTKPDALRKWRVEEE